MLGSSNGSGHVTTEKVIAPSESLIVHGLGHHPGPGR